MTWITVGSLILNSILALLFIVGAFHGAPVPAKNAAANSRRS